VNESATVRVNLLPRIRVAGAFLEDEHFSIGNAHFFPDTDENWKRFLNRTRPHWANIFCDDYDPSHEEAPRPAFGTLIFSKDVDWLERHVDKLVAIVFYLGTNGHLWHLPSESFAYYGWTLSNDDNQLVGFNTKHGMKIEAASSLSLQPPIELRGVQKIYHVDLKSDLAKELINRFAANPNDRLAVACFHLFRSQFSSFFHSPLTQDSAALCACLEAALNILGPEYSKQIVNAIERIYPLHGELPTFIEGLYSERSIFNHGLPIPSNHAPSDREKAFIQFRKRTQRYDVARQLCHDVIGTQLQSLLDEKEIQFKRLLAPLTKRLNSFFDSDDLWRDIRTRFLATQSINEITSLDDESQSSFMGMCCAFLNSHQWNDMTEDPDPKHVFQLLQNASAMLGKLIDNKLNPKVVCIALELYEAGKANDESRVFKWLVGSGKNWNFSSGNVDLIHVLKGVAWQVATAVRLRSGLFRKSFEIV